MNRFSRIALATSAVLATLMAVHTPVAARSSSNMGHGITCYSYPITGADGKVTYQRVCFKRP